MQPPTVKMIERCRVLGVDQVGLRSVRQFIEAALFHARMPDITKADQHVALNSNIRFATNRIACQGRHGHGVANCRLLSADAIRWRDEVLADELVSPRDKFGVWFKNVTEEHQDPVSTVGEWILERLPTIGADVVVERLLEHPSVIVTKADCDLIPRGMRQSGVAKDRYVSIGEPVPVDEGVAAFFDRSTGKVRKPRPSKYDVETVPWPD